MAAIEFLHLSLPLFLCFFHCYAQTQSPNSTIKLGSSIIAGSNEFWRSSSGDFAFGFHQIVDGRYLVGIVFDKIPERTLAWSVNRDDPAKANSTIILKPTGEFVLIHANNTQVSIYNGTATSSALMSNNGNFMLLNSSSIPIWQSFDHPTDTLLPGQTLRIGQRMFSNANGTVDYSTGRFMLEVQGFDGNVIMSAFHYVDRAYKFTGTDGNKNAAVVFNQTTAFLYVVNDTTIIYPMTTQNQLTVPVTDYYHRATVDDQGNFQQLIRIKNGGGEWRSVWKFVENPCMVSNICGVFGFCTTIDNQNVNCECLEGYSPIDPKIPSKGCYPNKIVDFCSDSNFKIVKLENADFPFLKDSDATMVRATDINQCEEVLRNDCFRTAAVYYDSACYKKRMPLLNARGNIPDTNNHVAFLKVPTINNVHSRKKSPSKKALLAIFVLCSTFALVFIAMAIYYNPITKGFFQRKNPTKPKPLEVNLKAFSFNELKEATNGFKNELGRGAFGRVYNGVLMLNDQEVEVAVKQLEKVIEQGEKEFITEVQVIGLTHHRNLVRLLGFCNEGDHRLLVYELMKNGPLSNFLFGEKDIPKWENRAKMVFEIANGLLYLHEECETQIIHCDIKPQNILLDKNYTVKISDFGLAKLMKKNQTHTATMIRGTLGYMAPEWLKNAPITTKVDVYSFGVMLLEIIFCRRHVEEETEGDDDAIMLVDWVVSCVRSERLRDIISHDSEAMNEYRSFERITMVGLWCIFPNPALRPSMKEVVLMIEGSIEVRIPPLVETDAYLQLHG